LHQSSFTPHKSALKLNNDFWPHKSKVVVFDQPFVKLFALCYRSVVCLSLCDVGVLWPNGWLDQDATWYRGRPWPRPHCVRWWPSSPQKGHSPPL